ncbi:hypothetical protein F4774DRAFT_410084 [Daldinia eschscholtzii]|nr:hypothetical protein F4774DRAFT_410084 [Daldinia eschscholtzii]
MLKVPLIKSALILMLEGYLVLHVLAVTCYHLDGSNAGPTNALCNPNATGGEGSHSACCNAQNADACLSTGLCLNTLAQQQSHVLWSTGCTDSTFKDPSCPQYCHGLEIDNAHLRSCNDTFWCCESDSNILTADECCNNAFKFTQPIGHVVAQLQSGGVALPLATSSPTTSNLPSTSSSTADPTIIPPGAVAGLAVEGVVIAVTFIVLGVMIWRNTRLRRKLKEAGALTTAQQQQLQQQYQWQAPPLSHAGATPHMAAYSYISPPASELPEACNELPGPDPAGTELSSEPRSPKPPGY